MRGLWVADGSTSIGFSASVDNDLLRKPATTHMPTVRLHYNATNDTKIASI